MNIDVNYDPHLGALKTGLYNRDLDNIRQLALTVYIPRNHTDPAFFNDMYGSMYEVLTDLRSNGWGKWRSETCNKSNNYFPEDPSIVCRRVMFINKNMHQTDQR